jgi:aminoacyl-tRNA hydrolase
MGSKLTKNLSVLKPAQGELKVATLSSSSPDFYEPERTVCCQSHGFLQCKTWWLIVVHDELELPFGDIKLKTGGGHKGHNGLRSINAESGSPDFHRIRFGIGRPVNPQMDVADHVLSNFSKEESDKLPELFPAAEDLILSQIKKIDSN